MTAPTTKAVAFVVVFFFDPRAKNEDKNSWQNNPITCIELLGIFQVAIERNWQKWEIKWNFIYSPSPENQETMNTCCNLSLWSTRTALTSENRKNYRRKEGIHSLTQLGWTCKICDHTVHIHKCVCPWKTWTAEEKKKEPRLPQKLPILLTL